jgi:hypothetical protein
MEFDPTNHSWAMVRYYLDSLTSRKERRASPRVEALDDLIHRNLRQELATMMSDDDDDF